MKKKIIILAINLIFLNCLLLAQQNVVSGVVTDAADGNALIGVTVQVKGLSSGTMTDVNGKYSINAAQGAKLIFSYIGMEKQELTVKGKQLNVVLQSSAHLLDEVVSIGYGKVKKSDLTGALSSVSSKELERTTLTTLEQGLAGRAAGVNVIETSGAPGGSMSMQIRGSNSMLGGTEPLYVIDGVPIDATNTNYSTPVVQGTAQGESTIPSSILSTINPLDIANIEVLKDASATAIYGSRGANGVVLITTKQGSDGKSKVTLSYSLGISNLSHQIPLLNAMEYAQYANRAQANSQILAGSTVTPIYVPADSITNPSTQQPFPTTPGTNWQNELTQTGITNNTSVNISAGNKTTKYDLSLARLDQSGILKSSSFNRSSIRLNLTSKLSDKISISSNNSVSFTQNHLVATSVNSDGGASSLMLALKANPIFTNSAVSDGSDAETSFINPYKELVGPKNLESDLRMLGGLNLTVNLSRELTLKISGNANYLGKTKSLYYPSTSFRGGSQHGLGLIATLDALSLINEDMLTYSKKLGKHNINLMGVFSYQADSKQINSDQVSNFPNDLLQNNAMQTGDPTSAVLYSNNINSVLASGTFRGNYNYADRYYITASIRADGSSKFSKDNKVGYFPSAAITWRVSEEPFLKKIDQISMLKFRYSYGKTGNQAIEAYQSLAGLGYFGYPFNGVVSPGYADVRFPNDQLKWETTDQHNLGLDFGFWKNRFSGSINLYQKITYDLLQQVVIPASSGWSSQVKNAGSISNNGIEIELTGRPIEKQLIWDVTLNYSLNRNKILSLGGVDSRFAPALGTGVTMSYSPCIQKVGYALGTLWGYRTDGIFQNAADVAASPDISALGEPKRIGEVKYKDITGDNIVNANDMTKIGDTNPDFSMNLINTFTWKGFDLQVFLQGVFGQDVFNQTRIVLMNFKGGVNTTEDMWKNSWNGEGSSNKYPMVLAGAARSQAVSDLFVENASFVRIKNIRLGYTTSLKKMFINTLKIYASVDNLKTFTNYSGYDPEVGSFGQDPSRRGVDTGNYPKSTTYTVGLNIEF